jgi:hypothetical protein
MAPSPQTYRLRNFPPPCCNGGEKGRDVRPLPTLRNSSPKPTCWRAVKERPDFVPALAVFAATSALTGRHDEAQKAIARLCKLIPKLRVSNLKDVLPFRRSEDLARYEEALRKAGLTE